MKLQKLKNIKIDNQSFIHYDVCNFANHGFFRRYSNSKVIRYYLFWSVGHPGKLMSELSSSFDYKICIFKAIIENTEKKK